MLAFPFVYCLIRSVHLIFKRGTKCTYVSTEIIYGYEYSCALNCDCFSGKRFWGVRVEVEVVRERVRERQSGQVLFRQHFQDRRVLGRLQNEIQGLPEAVSGEDRHDDAVHVRRRRHTRAGREHR